MKKHSRVCMHTLMHRWHRGPGGMVKERIGLFLGLSFPFVIILVSAFIIHF